MAQHTQLFSKTFKMPLSENVSTVPPGGRNKRVCSPDLQSNRLASKPKLRRSKSTSELNSMRSGTLKRFATTTIETIPEKMPKPSASASIGLQRYRPTVPKSTATIVRLPPAKKTNAAAGK